MSNKKQTIKQFEETINLAKAKAYSKTSLTRPLTDEELIKFKRSMENLKWNQKQ